MKIQQIEKELGISRANVRFYERAGLFLPKRNPLMIIGIIPMKIYWN